MEQLDLFKTKYTGNHLSNWEKSLPHKTVYYFLQKRSNLGATTLEIDEMLREKNIIVLNIKTIISELRNWFNINCNYIGRNKYNGRETRIFKYQLIN
jgi:hypothetical protein